MTTLTKAFGTLRWLPAWAWQQRPGARPSTPPAHIIIAIADHFEPGIVAEAPSRYAPLDEQERRVERWCREYPRAVTRWRDADGYPLCHTYFYPAEQFHRSILERLADHCHDGWGEIEVQLHHGVDAPDTADATRNRLVQFRDALAGLGCLSRWDSRGPARYAFVHGNWALANSAHGRYCGVDAEMQVLADTGCYADLTLPSAPSRGQVAKINALYEIDKPLTERAPHRAGTDLEFGRPPSILPLIIQGPLGLDWSRRIGGWPVPRIENGEISGRHPATLTRLALWERASVTVHGRPDWCFVKLHCHGMDPRDDDAMLGDGLQAFLAELTETVPHRSSVHFVSARELVNIVLAACDGREGNPDDFRDYRLRSLGRIVR